MPPEVIDIRQALDSMQAEVMSRAMRRLRMPDAFIALVVASLEGLSLRVRATYGLSSPFDALRRAARSRRCGS